uniref:Uncharacterized protein n=1 Tax=Romanomermis culicivorax TaxID=13658 RepID=A0A915L3C9_ROMCU
MNDMASKALSNSNNRIPIGKLTHLIKALLDGHLDQPFPTERNAIDTTLPNETKIFVPFGSAGGYRQPILLFLIIIHFALAATDFSWPLPDSDGPMAKNLPSADRYRITKSKMFKWSELKTDKKQCTFADPRIDAADKPTTWKDAH